MSSARFTAAVVSAPVVELSPEEVDQPSVASATLTTKGFSARPIRHLVWIYDLTGTKVDVIA